MPKRSLAAAAVILLLTAFLSARAEGNKKTVPLRDRLPAGVFLLFEVPDGNAFLASLCASAPGKALDLAGRVKRAGEENAAGWGAFFKAVSALEWGMAAALYPSGRSVWLLRERNGKGRELFDALMLLDPAAGEGMEEVKVLSGAFRLKNGYCRIREGEVYLCSDLSFLKKASRRRHRASAGGVLRKDGGWEGPRGGLYFFADLSKAGDDFFAGSERTFADVLGLSSVATVHWSVAPMQGFFHDRLLLKPSSKGWKGLAAASPMRGEPAFDGKLNGAFLRLALSLDAGDAVRRVMDALPASKKGDFDRALQLYRAAVRRDLYSDLSSAFDGNFEAALQLPETGILPHIAFSAGLRDPSLARTLFDFVNSSGVPLFPLSKKIGDTEIFYRKQSGKLGVVPCCAFSGGRLTLADSVPWLRSLLERRPEPFPPAGKPLHPMMKDFPIPRLAALYADNKTAARWMLSLLPLARLKGINLPFDPLDLPAPDEVAEMFHTTTGWLARDGKYLRGEGWSDFPLFGAAAAVFVMGKTAGFW